MVDRIRLNRFGTAGIYGSTVEPQKNFAIKPYDFKILLYARFARAATAF